MDKPWQQEPDILYGNPLGFHCLILRGPMQALCGYIGVPDDHPLHGVDYRETIVIPPERFDKPVDLDKTSILSLFGYAMREEGDKTSCPLDVIMETHGGLTYSDKYTPFKYLSHLASWWLGFDCAHSGDYTPRLDYDGVYRTIDYVKKELHGLAAQLRDWQ